MKGNNVGAPEVKSMTFDYSAIETQVKFLQGKVLTVIDASFADKEQKKAVKDLVNRAFSEQLTWVSQMAYPELPIYSRLQVEEMGVDVEEVEATAETI